MNDIMPCNVVKSCSHVRSCAAHVRPRDVVNAAAILAVAKPSDSGRVVLSVVFGLVAHVIYMQANTPYCDISLSINLKLAKITRSKIGLEVYL